MRCAGRYARQKGPGWQTRMNDDLRKAAKLKRSLH
ncbi:BrnA antitoxin family protein [Mesorhizobium australafricanum]